MTPSSSRKFVEFVFLCALSAAILWWLGRKLDWVEVRQAFSHSNKYLLGTAVLMACLVYLFQACRWGTLLAPLCPTSLRHLFAATMVGSSAIFLVGRLGEVVRPVVLPLRDPGVRASSSFITVMIDRIYDMVAVILLFAVNLLWLRPPPHMASEWFRVRIGGITLLIGTMAGIAALYWFRKSSRTTISWLSRGLNRCWFIPGRLADLTIRMLQQFAKALSTLADARTLAVTSGWTILVWVGIVAMNLLVIRGFGLPFGVTETIFVLGWSVVGSLVPTPAGAAGFYHAATAAGLIFLGIEPETAAAISIVIHLVSFGPALVFGFYFFVRGEVNLRRLRSLTSPEAIEHAVEEKEIVPMIP